MRDTALNIRQLVTTGPHLFGRRAALFCWAEIFLGPLGQRARVFYGRGLMHK